MGKLGLVNYKPKLSLELFEGLARFFTCFLGNHGYRPFWSTSPRGLSLNSLLHKLKPCKALHFQEVGVTTLELFKLFVGLLAYSISLYFS